MTDDAPQLTEQGNDLADGYPTPAKVLYAIGQHEVVPNRGLRRIEINCFASGDATFNLDTVDSEETLGGYLTRDDLT